MNESGSYEPPADVQKTGWEDAASRPPFRMFSTGALNFHSNPSCDPLTLHQPPYESRLLRALPSRNRRLYS